MPCPSYSCIDDHEPPTPNNVGLWFCPRTHRTYHACTGCTGNRIGQASWWEGDQVTRRFTHQNGWTCSVGSAHHPSRCECGTNAHQSRLDCPLEGGDMPETPEVPEEAEAIVPPTCGCYRHQTNEEEYYDPYRERYRFRTVQGRPQTYLNADCPGQCCQLHPTPPLPDDPMFTGRITCPATGTTYGWCEYLHNEAGVAIEGIERAETPRWIPRSNSTPVAELWCCNLQRHRIGSCNQCGGWGDTRQMVVRTCISRYVCPDCSATPCNCTSCVQHRLANPPPCPDCSTIPTNLCLDSEQYLCDCKAGEIKGAGGQVIMLVEVT